MQTHCYRRGLVKEWLHLLGQNILISRQNLGNLPNSGVILWAVHSKGIVQNKDDLPVSNRNCCLLHRVVLKTVFNARDDSLEIWSAWSCLTSIRWESVGGSTLPSGSSHSRRCISKPPCAVTYLIIKFMSGA